MVVIQYPHVMKMGTYHNGSESIDENGDTIINGERTEYDYRCRFEPNSKGEFITSADGGRIEFDWIVYFPLPISGIAEGAVVRGTDSQGSNQFAAGTIKRFNAGQMNARVWI